MTGSVRPLSPELPCGVRQAYITYTWGADLLVTCTPQVGLLFRFVWMYAVQKKMNCVHPIFMKSGLNLSIASINLIKVNPCAPSIGKRQYRLLHSLVVPFYGGNTSNTWTVGQSKQGASPFSQMGVKGPSSTAPRWYPRQRDDCICAYAKPVLIIFVFLLAGTHYKLNMHAVYHSFKCRHYFQNRTILSAIPTIWTGSITLMRACAECSFSTMVWAASR